VSERKPAPDAKRIQHPGRIRAAASRQGVALVTDTLARAELDAGSLVQLLDGGLAQEFAYWLVTPRATADQPPVAAFRAWILGEAGAGDAGHSPSP
jgi:LysR family glycine cleavage system transcriptional activator